MHVLSFKDDTNLSFSTINKDVGMRINHNISAMNAQVSVFKVSRSTTSSIEKLSTGLRINRASDDAAGLGVSENLRTQVRGLAQASKNTQDFIALLNIAEGALNEQSAILQRMRELVIQAKNDTYTQTERNYMGEEFQALGEELDRMARTTNYNGMKLFYWVNRTTSATGDPKVMDDATDAWDAAADAVFGANDDGGATLFNMMVGANYSSTDASAKNTAAQYNSFDKTAANLISVQLGQMDIKGLFNKTENTATQAWNFITGNGNVNPFDWNNGVGLQGIAWANLQDKLGTILQLIDGDNLTYMSGTGNPAWSVGTNYTGLERVNKMRAYIGAMINRLEHNMNNLSEAETNQQAAESLIRDVDFAQETATFTKNQILTQTATSMLAQANVQPVQIMRLLQ